MIALVTDADRNMVSHPACGMDATQTRAGVNTSLTFTSKLDGAVVVENALRAAVWRTADHVWLAGAVTAIPLSSWRIRVWATRVGVAGVFLYNWRHS